MKVCIVGCGNMGGAILKGALGAGVLRPEDVVACDLDEKAGAAAREFGAGFTTRAVEAVKGCQVVILAVKPVVLPGTIREISPALEKNALVVSIAAGVRIQSIRDLMSSPRRVARVMPNLAITVGEGMSALCAGDDVTESDMVFLERLFSSFGKTLRLGESKFDAFVALASSSPAMIFVLIEAMADAGVAMGLSRAQSQEMAAQAMLGSARMVLAGDHPAKLKDAVCSPAGTSIELVSVLEDAGVRGAVIRALRACHDKCSRL